MSATAALYQGPASGSSFSGLNAGQKIIRAYVKITPTGTYTANGDTLDLTVLSVPSSYAPIGGVLWSANPAGASGYDYQLLPAASSPTQANCKFQVMKGNGVNPNVDIGAGAYPAGVTSDTIVGFVEFIKQ